MEPIIDQIVLSFYQKCQNDFLIGYLFQQKQNFFSHTVLRLQYFWKRDLYKCLGLSYLVKDHINLNLYGSHMSFHLKKGEIGRWAVLFIETINENPQMPKILSDLWKRRIIIFRNLFWKRYSL